MSRKKRNYKVGYGKPPKNTRWKPGQSGNPMGRVSDRFYAYWVLANMDDPRFMKKKGKSHVSKFLSGIRYMLKITYPDG